LVRFAWLDQRPTTLALTQPSTGNATCKRATPQADEDASTT
jgi:hypothetical protein